MTETSEDWEQVLAAGFADEIAQLAHIEMDRLLHVRGDLRRKLEIVDNALRQARDVLKVAERAKANGAPKAKKATSRKQTVSAEKIAEVRGWIDTLPPDAEITTRDVMDRFGWSNPTALETLRRLRQDEGFLRLAGKKRSGANVYRKESDA